MTFTLALVAIAGSDFAAHVALKNYLVGQLDNQLDNISGRSIMRLDRAGINTNPNGEQDDQNTFRPVRPLGSVPTTTQITLLDLQGNVMGQLGGDFANHISEGEFTKLTASGVVSHQGKPFTIKGENDSPDIRAIARLLPSGLGSMVVAVSYSDINSTLNKLTGVLDRKSTRLNSSH